uniref:Amidohydrolase n=1 Tax=Candidatus Kentrum sp. LFY TaxID=2126342 RepID=A0A450UGR3_9GAMM|nr:MAG: Amidohydrolase [Candidatus Kentron sp. LFY]
MSDNIIYNCHNHLFTDENIPNNFYPFWLVPAARVKPIRWVISGLMKVVVPFTKNDKIHRYANFIKAAYRKTQENNLKHLIKYYPEKTKFIILPMDMSQMCAGKVKEDIDIQHEKLAELCKNEKYADLLIPFAHIEPRRNGALDRLKNLVENHGFKGVKIYPTLGYAPDHSVLMNDIYPYMIKNNIPLMAHCSRGFVNGRCDGITKEEAYKYADPDQYRKVMDEYPGLRICLAHFGGVGEWERHLNGENVGSDPTWVKKITDLLESDYKNIFADISYTIFNFQENLPYLKVLLQDKQIVPKVLFGSDFYMVESEKYSEKRLSIDLRASLGEDLFWEIANKNPRKYLGESV